MTLESARHEENRHRTDRRVVLTCAIGALRLGEFGAMSFVGQWEVLHEA